MSKKLLLVLALLFASTPSLAQNVTCATRPAGNNTNACASTAFVQTAIAGSSSSITIGSTVVTGGTTTRVLYDNAGVVGQYTISGTGNVAMTTSPAFTTPSLGAATATTINGNTFTTGTYTLTGTAAKTLTFSNTLTLAGTDSTTMTFPSSSANVAALNLASQALTGGVTVTPTGLSTGNITVNCGTSPIQTITNNGAYTITAPAADGYCLVKVTNGASAGATTFSGFSVGSNTGDALTTTNTNKFIISVIRAGGDSTYSIKALQ